MNALLRILLTLAWAAMTVNCTSSPSSDDIHASRNNATYNPGVLPPTQPTLSRGEGNSRVQGQIE